MFEYYEKLIEFLVELTNLKEFPNLIFGKDNKIIYNKKNIDFKYQEVNAKFYTENNVLYVNLDKHNLKSHDEIFAVVHEFRHFYQLNQVLNNNNDFIVRKWKNNFDNYLNFGENSYYEQDVEIDANAFTVYIISSLFNRACYINENFNSKKVDEYILLYEKEYSYIKIKNILKSIDFEPKRLFEL